MTLNHTDKSAQNVFERLLNLLCWLVLLLFNSLNVILLEAEIAEDLVKLFAEFLHALFGDRLQMINDNADNILEWLYGAALA